MSISIHAPHTGRDGLGKLPLWRMGNFNPRAPYGARRVIVAPDLLVVSNFNPRAPYGARRMTYSQYWDEDCISIHAPHTGRDIKICNNLRALSLFQSTRPIRGATLRQ